MFDEDVSSVSPQEVPWGYFGFTTHIRPKRSNRPPGTDSPWFSARCFILILEASSAVWWFLAMSSPACKPSYERLKRFGTPLLKNCDSGQVAAKTEKTCVWVLTQRKRRGWRSQYAGTKLSNRAEMCRLDLRGAHPSYADSYTAGQRPTQRFTTVQVYKPWTHSRKFTSYPHNLNTISKHTTELSKWNFGRETAIHPASFSRCPHFPTANASTVYWLSYSLIRHQLILLAQWY